MILFGENSFRINMALERIPAAMSTLLDSGDNSDVEKLSQSSSAFISSQLFTEAYMALRHDSNIHYAAYALSAEHRHNNKETYFASLIISWEGNQPSQFSFEYTDHEVHYKGTLDSSYKLHSFNNQPALDVTGKPFIPEDEIRVTYGEQLVCRMSEWLIHGQPIDNPKESKAIAYYVSGAIHQIHRTYESAGEARPYIETYYSDGTPKMFEFRKEKDKYYRIGFYPDGTKRKEWQTRLFSKTPEVDNYEIWYLPDGTVFKDHDS